MSMSLIEATKGMFGKGNLREAPLDDAEPKKRERAKNTSIPRQAPNTEEPVEARESVREPETPKDPDPPRKRLNADAFAAPEDAVESGLIKAATGTEVKKDGKNVRRHLKDPLFDNPDGEEEDKEEDQKPPILLDGYAILFSWDRDGDHSLLSYPKLMAELGYARMDYRGIPHRVYVLDYVSGKYIPASEVGMPPEIERFLIAFFWKSVTNCKIYAQENHVREAALYGAESEDTQDEEDGENADEPASDEATGTTDVPEDSKGKKPAGASSGHPNKKGKPNGKKKRPRDGANLRKNSEVAQKPEKAEAQPTAKDDAENPVQAESTATPESKPNAPKPVPEGVGTSVVVPIDSSDLQDETVEGSVSNSITVKVSEAAAATVDTKAALKSNKEIVPESGQIVDETQPEKSTAVGNGGQAQTQDQTLEVYDENPQDGVAYEDFGGPVSSERPQALAPKPLQTIPVVSPAEDATITPQQQAPAPAAAQQLSSLSEAELEEKLKQMLAEMLPQKANNLAAQPTEDEESAESPSTPADATGTAPANYRPAAVAAKQGTVGSGQPMLGVAHRRPTTNNGRPATDVAAAPTFVPVSPSARRLGGVYHP